MRDRRQRSAALPVVASADEEHQLTLFELGEDVSRLKELRSHLREVGFAAGNTKRALKGDWAHFDGWCSSVGRRSLPASEDTVELYIVACAGDMQLALATIERRLWAISRAHRESGRASPCGAGVRQLMRGLARERGREQRRVDAITVPELRAMVGTLDGRAPSGARDQAILLLGFSGGFRASELTAMELRDVRISDVGAEVRVRRSKTDQEGRGRSVSVIRSRRSALCAVAAVERWIRHRGAQPGRLFDVCVKWPWHVVKAAAAAAGLDASRFGAHSLRAGMMTELDRAGASLPAIMERSGHRSVQVAMRYMRHRQGAQALDPLAPRRGA